MYVLLLYAPDADRSHDGDICCLGSPHAPSSPTLCPRAGLSRQLLGSLQSSDVEHLICLNVALGRCYTNVLNQKESVEAYRAALDVSVT